MVLICVPLIIRDLEHLCMYLLDSSMSSSENVYSGHLPIFKLDFFLVIVLCEFLRYGY